MATDDEKRDDLSSPVTASREDARLRKLFEDVRDLAVAALTEAYASPTLPEAKRFMEESYVLQKAAGVIDHIRKVKASGGQPVMETG